MTAISPTTFYPGGWAEKQEAISREKVSKFSSDCVNKSVKVVDFCGDGRQVASIVSVCSGE